MKTKFSTGPWEIDGEDIIAPDVPCIRISAPLSSGGIRFIADICSDLDEATDDFVLGEEEWANAALISSAPELYQMLSDLAGYCHPSQDSKIQALLAKARGEYEQKIN